MGKVEVHSKAEKGQATDTQTVCYLSITSTSEPQAYGDASLEHRVADVSCEQFVLFLLCPFQVRRLAIRAQQTPLSLNLPSLVHWHVEQASAHNGRYSSFDASRNEHAGIKP